MIWDVDMKRVVLIIVLLLNLLFIKIDVYANADLKDLKANKQAVSCSGYECSIELDGNSAEITYEIGENVKKVSPSSGHTVKFDNDYSIQFEVIYQDDTTANYTLTIKKHIKSSDNTLKNLTINDEEMPLIDNVFVYSYDAKFNDAVIKIKGTPNDNLAKCEQAEYKFDLESSSLRIEYPVTAEDGTIKNYVINLKRKNKPDTTLKSLTLKDIEFVYDKNITDYEVTIPYSVNSTEVNAVVNHDDATVEVKKDEFFKVGENFIEIKVTNKEAFDTYVIKVNRLDKVDENLANLKSLQVKEHALNFNENVLEYNLLFKEIPNKLKLTYKTVSEEAKVEVLNNENFKDGSVVSIKVSLENGLTKVYKLTINEEKVVTKEVNKTLVIILIIILVIVMILLFVLEIKRKKRKAKRKPKKKEVREEDIEVI